MRLLKTENMELKGFLDNKFLTDTPYSQIDESKMRCHIRIFRLSRTETVHVSGRYNNAARSLR
jgi:hypothetical protein